MARAGGTKTFDGLLIVTSGAPGSRKEREGR
jgi:hypothetical protein